MQAIQISSLVLLAALAAVAVRAVLRCTSGPSERREANRRALITAFKGDNGWISLSLTLKLLGYAFPRVGQHASWLWMLPLVIMLLTWAVKGVGWMVRRRKRLRPPETAYTRLLRAASRESSRPR
jgi:hypothetical protein